MQIADDIRMYGRYARGLRGFLSRSLDAEDCNRLLERQRASRDDNFLRVLERAGDSDHLVRRPGLEQVGERPVAFAQIGRAHV